MRFSFEVGGWRAFRVQKERLLPPDLLPSVMTGGTSASVCDCHLPKVPHAQLYEVRTPNIKDFVDRSGPFRHHFSIFRLHLAEKNCPKL